MGIAESEKNDIQRSRENESLLFCHHTGNTVESCCNQSMLPEKNSEIALLRQELELFSKLLRGHENESSLIDDTKRVGQLHRRTSLNGEQIGTVMSNPEDLRELSREQLISHFKSEMTRLKREHDCTIQEMTEEYFSIKRRCLNLEEHRSFSSFSKDKEFKTKIADIISKLDKVLLENEKSVHLDYKIQLDSLLLENRQLKDSLLEAEANHRSLNRKLELDIKDSRVEACIYGHVYESFVGEFVKQIECAKEEAGLEHQIVREAYELIPKVDLEDSCFESYMAEEFCAVIYKEALKEADEKLGELNMNLSEKERVLRAEMAEKERSREEIHCALEKTKCYEIEISELRQELELVRKKMEIAESEKEKLEWGLSSSEAKHKRLEDQVFQMALSFAKWTQGFDILECLVAEEMKKKNSRLESMQSQLRDLLDEVDELKARESMYKQRMEKKTCDLHKAETEVDLLGDEMETLLELLEKIYIGLDHYSPILKHYPGIIEILKLVRRELRGESKRPNLI